MGLVSGSTVRLTGENPTLSTVGVSFTWDVRQPSGPQIELVPAVLLLGANERAIGEEMVFFNQLSTPEGDVKLVEQSNMEVIEVELGRVPAEVESLVFVAYVNPDSRSAGTFEAVRETAVSLFDVESNARLCEYEVPVSKLRNISALLYGELYRHKGEWKFRALGDGYSDGVQGVAAAYGLQL